MNLTHYTLNTGQTACTPRSAVGPEALAFLRPLVAKGGGKLPGQFAAFRVDITLGAGCAAFTVYRGQEPIVLCAVAWDQIGEIEAWAMIERTYLGFSDSMPELVAPGKAPEQPTSLPWLGVVILPFIAHQTREDVSWLADFERCLAWAIIEHPKK